MSAEEQERQPFWTDGKAEIYGGECGAEWGTWQLWYLDVPVIEGSYDVVVNYWRAEFARI